MARALRDIPAIRALAEREAREHFDAVASALASASSLKTVRWDGLTEHEREVYVEGQIGLLADLTRHQSAASVAGIIADRAASDGREPVSTAPHNRPEFWLTGPEDDAGTLKIASDGVVYEFPLAGFHGWDDTHALALIADAVLP